jgi:hypothetical protein
LIKLPGRAPGPPASFCCFLYIVEIGVNEFTGPVANGREGKLILNGVREFDIADGVGGVLDEVGNAFIVFGSRSDGPVERGSAAYGGGPRRTHRGKEIGPDPRGAAAIGAMDDGDGGIGRVYVAV